MTEFQIWTYAICKSDLFYDISGFLNIIVEVFDILETCAFCRLVFGSRRIGTTYRSHPQGSSYAAQHVKVHL